MVVDEDDPCGPVQRRERGVEGALVEIVEVGEPAGLMQDGDAFKERAAGARARE